MSAQVKTIPTVPLFLRGDRPDRLAVYDEIYIPKSDFSDLNVRRVGVGEDAFVSPRSVATGTFRNLDPSVVVDRPFAVFFYDILDANVRPDSQWAMLDRLCEWGLRVTDYIEHAKDVTKAIGYRDRIQTARNDPDYEIDGMVIRVDSQDARERLGEKSRSVRWVFAYKFPARHEMTTARDIVVQVGRTGRLIPVAALDPVSVGSVTVLQATLYDLDERAAPGVAVGDHVRVERADDVIPQMIKVTEDGGGCYEFPGGCPVCESAVDHDGPLAFYSGGLSYPAQREASIGHFAVKGTADIDGLGEGRVAQLADAGLVKTVADLYDLMTDDLAELKGQGETGARNLVVAVENTKHPSLDSFLVGSSISEAGETAVHGLAREFGSVETFPIEADAEEDEFDASEERLTTVPDVGEMVAHHVRNSFEDADNRVVICALLDRGTDPELVESGGDGLDGLVLVVTRTLAASRSSVTELAEPHGSDVTGSVSDNTGYLVVGENPDRSEHDDVEVSDVSTLAETEFEALPAEHGVTYPPEQNGQSIR